MECSIALLEAGAQIMAVDILGLRPFDLCPVSAVVQWLSVSQPADLL